MSRPTVAVVGAGISGLTAAYRLRESHDVTVFEAEPRPGGHANTVAVPFDGGELGIDTGFIVYNEATYPGFTALLRELNVPTQPGDMSFGASCERCGVSYSSRGLAGLFAQPRSLLRPAHWRLLADLDRFYRHARVAMRREPPPALSLAEYARRFGRSRALIAHYLVPMAAAIWSTPPSEVLQMPFASVVRFLANHGLIGWGGRLQWRTVSGGSRAYVDRLVAALPPGSVRAGASVQSVHRDPASGVCVRSIAGEEAFGAVVLACHADEALALLADPSPEEQSALSRFAYTQNDVILHTDASVLPSAERARASWNVSIADCQSPAPELTMTYSMNRLQRLPGVVDYCVSVNPGDRLDPRLVISRHRYTHPRYGPGTVAAQAAVQSLQGESDTYFAGAHLGYGFHEDGYQSGARAAALLAAKR